MGVGACGQRWPAKSFVRPAPSLSRRLGGRNRRRVFDLDLRFPFTSMPCPPARMGKHWTPAASSWPFRRLRATGRWVRRRELSDGSRRCVMRGRGDSHNRYRIRPPTMLAILSCNCIHAVYKECTLRWARNGNTEMMQSMIREVVRRDNQVCHTSIERVSSVCVCARVRVVLHLVSKPGLDVLNPPPPPPS